MQDNNKFVMMSEANKEQVMQTPPSQQAVVQNQATYQQNTSSNSNISTSDLTQTVETDKRGRVKKPIISYRYTVINGMGKKETGTFDAEGENDVRNFFLSLDYQVLEVKERSALDVDISGGRLLRTKRIWKTGKFDVNFPGTSFSRYIGSGKIAWPMDR